MYVTIHLVYFCRRHRSLSNCHQRTRNWPRGGKNRGHHGITLNVSPRVPPQMNRARTDGRTDGRDRAFWSYHATVLELPSHIIIGLPRRMLHSAMGSALCVWPRQTQYILGSEIATLPTTWSFSSPPFSLSLHTRHLVLLICTRLTRSPVVSHSGQGYLPHYWRASDMGTVE